jgi:predicted dehydrogenase
MGPVRVGVIGAGVISEAYLRNLTRFPDITVAAIGDLRPDAAEQRAQQFGIPEFGGPDVVLGHPDVELVVNLTIPVAHVEVGLAAVAAGKHVWSEKPMALDRSGGSELLAAAERAGVRIGCAPDTFLGPGLQAARRVLDAGGIGTPLTALALMQTPGPEAWHPNPAFLYQRGAGPLFDIGPYYLTVLVQVFGPIAAVAGSGSTASPTRVIGSGPLAGQEFEVEVPTHVGAVLRFADGRSAQCVFSFDSPARRTSVEVTGTDATLALPDPNRFDGEVRRHPRGGDWETVATADWPDGRGLGVLDLARAIRTGEPHRAAGTLAQHVLDVMESIIESIETGRFVDVRTTTEVPAPLPADWDPYAATL